MEEKYRILFQGDSVTDCGRDRANLYDLGLGYPRMIAGAMLAAYPEANYEFINKGVSGDRVRDIVSRMQEDIIDLKPDFISILIGINDCWRRYDSNDPTSAEAFEADYRKVLTAIKENTDAEIMLMEPFVLPSLPDRETWREDLDAKIDAVRRLAREFGTQLLPLDGMLNAAAAQKDPKYWTEDGVHPSVAGHGFIANAWMEIF